ncbi:MAG: hypothetical protein IPJ04_07985 [Candidatus Eisenbacteria bacterium]|nr:hypothetical protein [Candidatus Eisenbacteria bacterium]
MQLDQGRRELELHDLRREGQRLQVKAAGKSGRPTDGREVTYTYPSGDWTSGASGGGGN